MTMPETDPIDKLRESLARSATEKVTEGDDALEQIEELLEDEGSPQEQLARLPEIFLLLRKAAESADSAEALADVLKRLGPDESGITPED